MIVKSTHVLVLLGVLAVMAANGPVHANDVQTPEEVSARIAEFQQQLEEAVAEAKREEAERLRVYAIVKEGVTAQGGGEGPAERISRSVEQKMNPAKMTLKSFLERIVGMCAEEIRLTISTKPSFIVVFRPKRTDETSCPEGSA